jgi:membrane peptidoglycan carboxypeptidase
MAVVLGLIVLVAWTYLLQVYAPGLRQEARVIPALVRDQLTQHNAPYTPINAIAPNLQHAIVAIEDRRFYHHPGIDVLATVRALWVNLQAQHVDQGGSTLEEQLVKRAIVHDDSSIHAKLRTMAVAWAVDQEFDKRTILEMYLNAAYYGQGAYGVDAAAHTYFGTNPAELSLSQAALLAALPQAPSVYGANPTSPTVIARQHTVLQDMENQGYITAEQEHAAVHTRLTFAFPNP